ncbi:hypothetical protein K502DRAFT_365942 [Neoconidiobolus thromboides FSU 785]|nr:hypothetical protein K502DRAFT_365942 [Neoconidiobolus thromboides FSU 785]
MDGLYDTTAQWGELVGPESIENKENEENQEPWGEFSEETIPDTEVLEEKVQKIQQKLEQKVEFTNQEENQLEEDIDHNNTNTNNEYTNFSEIRFDNTGDNKGFQVDPWFSGESKVVAEEKIETKNNYNWKVDEEEKSIRNYNNNKEESNKEKYKVNDKEISVKEVQQVLSEEIRPEAIKKKGAGLINFNNLLNFRLKRDVNSGENKSKNLNFNKNLKIQQKEIVVKNVLDLPHEVLMKVFQLCSVQSLLRLKQVNRRFMYFIQLDATWAIRLKWIEFSKIDWGVDINFNELNCEQILKCIWSNKKKEYLQFERIENQELELFNQKDLAQISNQLYQLIQFSKAMIVDNWYIFHHNLLIMKEYYEASLLNNLNLAYSEMDMEELKIQCLALQGLQGNNLGIKWLVEQNPIFVFHDYKSPETLDDLDLIYDMMVDFYQKIQEQILLENDLLIKIFNDSKEGNTVFIEQLFRDCISGFLIPILSVAEEQSDMLPSIYGKILVKSFLLGQEYILKLDIPMDLHRVELSYYYLYRPQLDIFVKNEMLYLDLNYSTLCKNFLFQMFGNEEIEQLKAKSNNLKSKLNLFDTKFFLNQKNILLDSMTKAFKSNSFNSNNNSNNNSSDMYFNNDNNENKEFNFSEFISIKLIQQLILMNEESLQRIIIFEWFDKLGYWNGILKNHMEFVFHKLIHYINEEHLFYSFEFIFKQLRKHQSNQYQTLKGGELVLPVLSFFTLILQVDYLMELIDNYYISNFIKFKLIDKNDFLNSCNIIKKKFETKMDEIIANGLDLSIQTLMLHVDYLLKYYQTALDFRPQSQLNNLKPSKACQEVINCLIHHVTKVKQQKIDIKILNVFYNEIALRLFHDLIKHIKKFTINQYGGYQLLSDLSAYFSWILTLELNEIMNHYQALKEVANIYLMDSEDLKILIQDQERFLGIFHLEELLEFVQRREDYKKIQKKIEIEGCSLM